MPPWNSVSVLFKSAIAFDSSVFSALTCASCSGRLLSIAFLFSGFFFDLVQNVVTAPIHAKILKRRELSMRHAKANGINTVVVQPYEQEASIILDSLFPSKKRFIKEEFVLPPSFSHFKDEPHRKVYAFFYAEYYGIDTVVGNEGKVWRWGLKEGGDPWR